MTPGIPLDDGPEPSTIFPDPQDFPPEKSPRTVIAALDMNGLVVAVAGNAVDWDPVMSRPTFRCPHCPDGTALAETEGTWRCAGCGHHGTRYELERIVLEDANRLGWFLGQTRPGSWIAFRRGELR